MEDKQRKKRGRPRGVLPPKQETSEQNEIIQSNIEEMKENPESFYHDIGEETPPIITETPAQEVPPVIEPEPAQPQQSPPVQDEQSAPFTDPILSAEVDTKSYAKGMGGDIPLGDIPEAEFTPPKNIVDESKPQKAPQQIPQSQKIEPLNAEVNEMSDAEKKAGAELTVQSFWSGYEKVNMLIGSILQVPYEKRLKMHNEGLLDLTMQVQVGVGEIVTVNDFYEQYNKDVKELFVVDPALKSRLDAPMKREAMRLGLIMSDKQVILLGLGEDIVTKAVQVFSIKKSLNAVTKAMQDHYAELKKQNEILAAQEKKKSSMVDPETEEGQQKFYEFYRRIKDMEANDIEKAKAVSDLFEQREVVVERPEPPTVKKSDDLEYTPVEEVGDNLDIRNEI